jgi:hypothetical protein
MNLFCDLLQSKYLTHSKQVDIAIQAFDTLSFRNRGACKRNLSRKKIRIDGSECVGMHAVHER